MLEDHAMEELRFPSSGSLAVPVKVTLEPGSALLPSAGAVMVTGGGGVGGAGDDEGVVDGDGIDGEG